MTKEEDIITKEELLTELSECRSDERDSTNRFTQVIATAGTVLALVLGSSAFTPISKSILFQLSSLVFCIAVGYCNSIAIESRIRFHYIRAIEDYLGKLQGLPETESAPLVHWISFVSPIATHNFKHAKNRYAKMHFFAFMVSLFCMLAFCLYVIGALFSGIPNYSWLDKTMLLFSVIFLLFNIYAFLCCTSNAVEMYSISKSISMRSRYLRLTSNESTIKRSTTSDSFLRIIFYFIFPRKEAFVKSILLICGFFYGVLVQRINISYEMIINQLLPSFVVIEFLFYQSRYQWNDLRGLSEDVKSSKSGRLPRAAFGYKTTTNLSIITMIIKLICAIVVVIQMKEYSVLYVCILVVLFILTVLYEQAREKKKSIWVFILVCLGYPIRFFSGFILAFTSIAYFLSQKASSIFNWIFDLWPKSLSITYSMPSVAVISIIFIFIAFLGGNCVILSWTREALNQFKKKGYPGIVKPHYIILIKKVCSKDQQHPLSAKTNGHLFQPWNYTFLLSVLLLAIAAFLLKTNLLLALISECLILILSIIISCSGHSNSRNLFLKLYPYLLYCITVVVKSLVTYLLYKSISFSYLLIGIVQVLSMLIYSSLRFIYIEKISLKFFISKLWLKFSATIIGKETVLFLINDSKDYKG